MSTNAYEQMKNLFYLELTKALPNISKENMILVGKALDIASYQFEVKVKETSLAVIEDPVPILVKTYIAVKKTEGLSDGTLSNYYHILKAFFIWIRKQPSEVTTNDIRMFLYDYQRKRNISSRTLDKYREFICWFFTWAHEEEYIQRNPGKPIKPLKYETKERQALTQIELEYLRLVCKTPRDKAIVEFLYSTGCRVSELTGTKISDVDFKYNTVHLFGKGRKHRTSFINAKCEVALREYLKSRTDESEYLFVSERKPHGKIGKCTIENILKRLSEEAGMPKKITPHILRHTTATQAVNNGMAIEEVSKLLGHASVATTMIYAKVSQDNIRAQHVRCVI